MGARTTSTLVLSQVGGQGLADLEIVLVGALAIVGAALALWPERR